MIRDTFSITLADAATAARDDEGQPDPELTWSEAREQMNIAPPPRCVCGCPLARLDGWLLKTCWDCSELDGPEDFAAVPLPRGGEDGPGALRLSLRAGATLLGRPNERKAA